MSDCRFGVSPVNYPDPVPETKVRPKIRHVAPLDGCAWRLKNEFTEDEKCRNLMRWL